MSIEKEIISWDGKSVNAIKGVYNYYSDILSFPEIIINLLNDIPCQKGASWLLKFYFESGNQIDKYQITKVYNSLDKLEHWETKLHLLQCFAFMPIAKTEKNKVHQFLRATLADSHNFVRAWTYNGFYVLATQYPEYLEETKKLLETAMKNEAASVKARIRNIMKSF